MPNFKVLNPDNPEEIDLIQDIPVVDEETGSDQIDEEGNVIVKRYITRSVNKAGITAIKAALPQIKENTKNLQELHEYSHSLNATQQKQIDDNASDISTLLSDVSALELSIVELENKIKGIQGIDIDDLKEYVETQIPLIKSSYLPLTGGTITGNLKVTEGTVIGNLTGTSDKAVSDKNGKNLTDYVTDILGANAQLTITKGDGTNQLISINNVLAATKATQDNKGQQIDTTYIKGLAANNATLTYTKGDNTIGNITINNVANATTATKATKATSDANGANIASTYTKLATAQTISAQHNFSTGVKISGYLVTIG